MSLIDKILPAWPNILLALFGATLLILAFPDLEFAFLAWFEAQTGRTVVFADPTVESALRNAVQSGSIDVPPLQKLSAVLVLNDLTYALDAQRVVIRTR